MTSCAVIAAMVVVVMASLVSLPVAQSVWPAVCPRCKVHLSLCAAARSATPPRAGARVQTFVATLLRGAR